MTKRAEGGAAQRTARRKRRNAEQERREWAETAGGKIEVGTRVVEDPYGLEPGARMVARVNLAEHPLDRMRARGRLDEAQYCAGVRFRAIYERAEIGGARAIDLTRIRVDGGSAGDPLSASCGEAHRELSRIAGYLGVCWFRLVSDVCGAGIPVSALAARWSGREHGRQVLDHLTISLKQALDVLAGEVWGARGLGRVAMTGYAAGCAPDMSGVDEDAANRRYLARRGVSLKKMQTGG